MTFGHLFLIEKVDRVFIRERAFINKLVLFKVKSSSMFSFRLRCHFLFSSKKMREKITPLETIVFFRNSKAQKQSYR